MDRYAITFVEFPSLSFRKSVCCYFNSVCIFFYDENKSGSDVNELRYRKFTKTNLRGYRLPPTLDVSVLQSINIFSSIFVQYILNSFSSFIKNIKNNIEKSFSILFT